MTDVNVTWTIVAWIVTVLLIPVIILLWKTESRRVTEKIVLKEAADAERHNSLAALVTERHNAVMRKLLEYCQRNRADHGELYTYKNDMEKRITVIEATHHQNGCDQPTKRLAG